MSGSDYNYDEQAQFYPFFILTIAGIITLPLTYNVLKKDTNVEASAAPRQDDHETEDDDLIKDSRRKAKRKERKLKRILAVILGYAVMAGMIYLIVITARVTPRLYNPYDVLGVSTVSVLRLHSAKWCTATHMRNTIANLYIRVPARKRSKSSTTNSP